MNEKEMKIGHEFAAVWLNICKVVSFQPLFDFLQKKKVQMSSLTWLSGQAFRNQAKVLHHNLMYYEIIKKICAVSGTVSILATAMFRPLFSEHFKT